MAEDTVFRKLIHIKDRGDCDNLPRIGLHLVNDDKLFFVHYQHTCGALERWVDQVIAQPHLNDSEVLVLFSRLWFPSLCQVVEQNYQKVLSSVPEGADISNCYAPSLGTIGICMCGLDTWHLMA